VLYHSNYERFGLPKLVQGSFARFVRIIRRSCVFEADDAFQIPVGDPISQSNKLDRYPAQRFVPFEQTLYGPTLSEPLVSGA